MRAQAALVETTGGPFTLRDVDIVGPGADEILVRITAAGICHTDLAMRRRWPAARLPMVFGHEGAGVVEAVGASVTTVAPGDQVCLSFRSCGECVQCRAGQPAYCRLSDLNTRGVSSTLRRGGAPVFGGFFGQSSFATHAITYPGNTVKIPADFPATLAAPLGCGVQTGAGTVLNVLDPAPGETIVIFGAGGVGLSALLAGLLRDCRVIVVEPRPARRDLAVALGAAEALDPAADLPARVLKAHHAIDTTGRPETISQAIDVLRRRGTLALVGIGGTANVDIMTVLAGGISIRGVIEGDADPAVFLPYLIDLHRQGRFPLERLITTYPFAEIERAAQDALTGKTVKPVLTFQDQDLSPVRPRPAPSN
ncbi:NAD(P)-dependent alcohol dehydrogenase [Actinoplanes regularis]|uniref:Aryl-alcohol dehydrogenase n=1 Tax=Actinoplanes regularis TaxID=52697 RepID=A0A239I602_9ACTN|nr:NAD(P)-dependent alcohol dehydrogenase [Actinoplanes regularis]GIE91330.1 zinc-binding alcohol dehydrogenase [Actinoplanes regularis]SNS89007.1 aryl-alcohol dehydrogenase [Actinoplanes regularis]